MTDPSIDNVVIEMRKQLEDMKNDPDRTQLTGTSPDDAFELGYHSAIQDLLFLTGHASEEN